MAIIKRGASYGVRIKRGGKQIWIGTFRTLKEARAAEAEARTKRARLDVHKLNVSELITLFHEQHTEFKSTSTQSNYRHALKRFQERHGGQRAAAITFIEAQAFAADYARSIVDVASTMYEWARRAKLLEQNPFDGVLRRQVTKRTDVAILTPDEVDHLAGAALRELDTPMAEQMAALIMFSAGTGLRPGESFALTWGDIDFKAGRVHVSKAIGSKGEVKMPKNGKARQATLLTQAREGLHLLHRGEPDELIFTSNRDSGMQKATLAYRWHLVRSAAGRKGMRFYDLRHTFATRLLELGAFSYEVAEALGHQDGGRLVERTYGHPSTEKALDRIAELDRVAAQARSESQGVTEGITTSREAAS